MSRNLPGICSASGQPKADGHPIVVFNEASLEGRTVAGPGRPLGVLGLTLLFQAFRSNLLVGSSALVLVGHDASLGDRR